MYNKLVFLFWGFFLNVFMIGCVTGGGGMLDSYQSKSTAESGIIKSFMDYQEAFNRKDLAGCLSLIHENAQLQTSNSGSIAPKKDYSNTLELAWGYGLRIEFSSPDITINGDQAVVKMRRAWTYVRDGRDVSGYGQVDYNMVRVGDRWLIMQYKYY